MSRARVLFLAVLLALACMLPRDTGAQQTWPTDQAGVPAPPCTFYDPIANVVTYCNALNPIPTTAAVTIVPPQSPSAFGQGYFTGWDGVVGLPLQSAPAFLFLDETTVVGVGSRSAAGNTANLYRSADGGRTMSLTTITTGANTAGLRNMVRSASGLYIIGARWGGGAAQVQVQTSRNLTIFASQTAGLPALANASSAVYQASNTIVVTEDVGQNVCRATVSAFALGAFACAVPPSWTGPIVGSSSVFSVAHSTNAGAAGGIWIGVDKASPNANIIRSTDDGATWSALTTLGEGTAGVAAHAVICLRNTPAICLIGLNGATYRSVDSGATWALVASFTTAGLTHAFLDYGQGTIVAVGSPFGNTVSPTPPGCPPDCGIAADIQWARSIDAGVTWMLVPGGLGHSSGNAGDSYTSAITSPTTGRAILSPMRAAAPCPGSSSLTTCYIYSPIIPPAGTVGFSSGGIGSVFLNHGEAPQAGPVQGGGLFNSQTTGGATTAVTVTLTGLSGYRVHVYSVEARCNTGGATTTGVTLTDAAVTKWSTGATDVPGGTVNYRRPWTPGYTAGDGASVVITLAACSAGTGTLIVQADQF